jgi:hypothetical protein
MILSEGGAVTRSLLRRDNLALFVYIMTPSHVMCFREVASPGVDSAAGEIEILPEHRLITALLDVSSSRLKLPNGKVESRTTLSGILKFENDWALELVPTSRTGDPLSVGGQRGRERGGKVPGSVSVRGTLDNDLFDR